MIAEVSFNGPYRLTRLHWRPERTSWPLSAAPLRYFADVYDFQLPTTFDISMHSRFEVTVRAPLTQEIHSQITKLYNACVEDVIVQIPRCPPLRLIGMQYEVGIAQDYYSFNALILECSNKQKQQKPQPPRGQLVFLF